MFQVPGLFACSDTGFFFYSGELFTCVYGLCVLLFLSCAVSGVDTCTLITAQKMSTDYAYILIQSNFLYYRILPLSLCCA